MKKGYFFFFSAALLSLGLFTSQALAQTESFCSATGHSGTSKTETGSYAPGSIGQYDYQLWYDHANSASATFYSDGSMSCKFSGAGDYLCRSGLQFNSDKTYDQMGGDIIAEYKLVKKNISGVDYSYVGVYGWMEGVQGAPNGLVEYYVVDNTLSQWMPGDWVGNKKVAENVSIDGGTYTVYRNTRTGPAIGGNSDREFYQYFSIRNSMRDCGTINVSAHIKKWKELGLADGKLYEAKVLGEAGANGGGVSGEADFPHAVVYISNGTTPTSSASTNPTSSASTPTSSAAQNQPSVGTLPGTIEFEDYQSTGGADLTKNGTTLGSINPGAWVEFGVDVSYTGTYEVEVLAARKDADGNKSNLTISIDGKDVGSISDILTDDWSDFKPFTGTTTNIDAGKHTLRVTFDYGWLDVDNIKFTAKDVNMSSKYEPPTSSASAPTSSGSVAPASNGSTTPANNGTNPSNNGAGNEAPEAIGNIHMSLSTMDMQVFDVQGRSLGRVRVNAGVSLEETLFAKFHKSGIYLVKQGSQLTKVRVIR